jgi:hypothetical protein
MAGGFRGGTFELANSMELALLDKPPVALLLKSFLTFYGTRRFITVNKI